jgi:hypothetical protein
VLRVLRPAVPLPALVDRNSVKLFHSIWAAKQFRTAMKPFSRHTKML